MGVLYQILALLGSLALFLYGMMMLSESVQKIFGAGMRRFMTSMMSNRFKLVLTGLVITAIIQSSSATTVMAVNFVNTGLFSLSQAIGVILGANVGTTVTGWVISLFGMRSGVESFAIPLIALGFIFMMMKSAKKKSIGELIVSISFILLGICFLKQYVPSKEVWPGFARFITEWSGWGYGSILIFILLGGILSIAARSSSATLAITLVFAGTGWLPFDMSCAMVIGENIGTTVTANIAARGGNVSAKRAALTHTLFNVFGAVLTLLFFYPFLHFISWTVRICGGLDPFTSSAAAAAGSGSAMLGITCGISLFHTLFNLFNTIVMFFLVPSLEKIVVKLVPPGNEEEVYYLKYLQGGLLATPELSLAQVRQEIVRFCQLEKKQFGYVREALIKAETPEFDVLFKKLSHYEQIADRVEYEIAEYLNKIAESELGELAGRRMQSMYKIIGELESVGDSGYNIGRILQRKNLAEEVFTPEMQGKLFHMLDLLDAAFDAMIFNCSQGYESIKDINNASVTEQAINDYRDARRDEHMKNLENGVYGYQVGAYYFDIIAECERVGDFIINVSEALMDIKEEKR
ncbi:MAG: Na/Pi cotransporter family protein [Bacteroidales bacterium]|jgi:phosphate:Na+ symporter|nr:Na/Pi cotransporter family protein [Bacteroidales bacterium]MCI2121168.1 Na/Pi cotransporter family protein [Bacteroidales bacterium]MCI2145044.1 Na/Pi cotransporter family protein [Bacteroidales bacterium]